MRVSFPGQASRCGVLPRQPPTLSERPNRFFPDCGLALLASRIPPSGKVNLRSEKYRFGPGLVARAGVPVRGVRGDIL